MGQDIINQNSQISGFDDPGAHGLTFILGQVKERNNNFRILASGQGGDEIYSNMQNYHFGNPNPKRFPRRLSKVFPVGEFFLWSTIKLSRKRRKYRRVIWH